MKSPRGFGTKVASRGKYQVMTMAKANTRQANASARTAGAFTKCVSLCAPPSAHQAPNTNSNCQAKGLNTQVPLGYAGMFHSNSHISAYSVADASSAIDGARNSSHSIGGNHASNSI